MAFGLNSGFSSQLCFVDYLLRRSVVCRLAKLCALLRQGAYELPALLFIRFVYYNIFVHISNLRLLRLGEQRRRPCFAYAPSHV